MNFFWEIHKDLLREGPGEEAATQKAFAMLRDLPEQPKILDIGCGPGAQTVTLAKLTDGMITAVDAHTPFLADLAARAREEGVGDRIRAQKGDMFQLEFPESSFDLIWSEGAVFIIGFQRGLKEWRTYVKEGGYLVISEISWLRDVRPAEIEDFWMADYPEIKTVAENLKVAEEAGYEVIGHFTLAQSGWWNYYRPLEERLQVLKARYADDPEAKEKIRASEVEIEMYRKFSDYYGYEFYIMRKVS